MENSIKKIPFLAGAKCGNDIFFSALYVNGLFKYNCEKGVCNFIKSFAEEANAICLHRKAFVYKKTIWFIPWEAKKISIYDVEKDTISYLNICDEEKRRFAYWDAYKKKNIIYCVPYETLCLPVILDMENKKISYGERINHIANEKVIGVSLKENTTTAILRDGEIIRKRLGISENENVCSCEYERGENKYISTIDLKNEICLCPFEAEELVIIDKIEYKVKQKIKTDKDCKYSFGKNIGNKIVMFPAEYNREFLILNRENNMLTKQHVPNEYGNEWIEMVELDCEQSDGIIISDNVGNVMQFDSDWNMKENFQIFMGKDEYEKSGIITKKLFEKQMINENIYTDVEMFLLALSN